MCSNLNATHFTLNILINNKGIKDYNKGIRILINEEKIDVSIYYATMELLLILLFSDSIIKLVRFAFCFNIVKSSLS